MPPSKSPTTWTSSPTVRSSVSGNCCAATKMKLCHTDQMVMTETPEAESVSLRDYRPGAFALRDAWFPVVHANMVRRNPKRRAIQGAPVWVWRDNGALRATEDSPADLERGRRRTSELTYGTGDSPLVEGYGHVWAWYGNPESSSPDLVPSVLHIPVEGEPRRMENSIIYDCSYELVCENLLDLTHADFLHSALTGEPLGQDDDITVTSTSETVTMVRTATNRPVPKMQKPFVKGATHQSIRLVTLVHIRSGACIIHGDFNPGISVRLFQPVTPESANRCRGTTTLNPQHCSKLARNLFPLNAHVVNREDNRVLRVQNRYYVDDVDRKDLSSRFDRAAVRYRRVYQDLVARQAKGDFGYLPDGDPARDIREELGLDRRAGE